MKKVLIGVGVGCGLIILVGVGLLVAGGLWAKNTFGGSIEAGQKLAAQEEELAKLNQSIAFQAPPEGEVLALDAKRLETYFAVREGALPVFKAMEQKADAFEKEHGGDDKKNANFGAAVDAANMMMTMTVDVRAAYLEGLKKHGMSPAEFQTITTTVYTSLMADGMEQAQGALKQSREAMEKQLAALDKKLEGDSLSDEERTQTEEAQTHLRTAIEAMEKGEANPGLGNLTAEGRKVAAANVALLKTYDKQVQAMASSAFDSFLLGGSATDAPEGASAQEDD
ncbi:hypothetical protein [Pyxidicoccus caerfyrddinensis]|uniref:hypothetical protein n=1 Tax=Pyxidicoccus caerfyrddinensis TaxID=2709663 RepID=UPI0013D8E6FF|nr:hypothetical protein [Pyxidicoccus caerfyrddinensis]